MKQCSNQLDRSHLGSVRYSSLHQIVDWRQPTTARSCVR